jgi:hypothetical protein
MPWLRLKTSTVSTQVPRHRTILPAILFLWELFTGPWVEYAAHPAIITVYPAGIAEAMAIARSWH